ncbi:MAG: hypothetical protein J5616_06190, partial [Bacteroidaceae bacterium]|nr:hypothetical protein [Bacteroidaceae bacterium]
MQINVVQNAKNARFFSFFERVTSVVRKRHTKRKLSTGKRQRSVTVVTVVTVVFWVLQDQKIHLYLY